MLGSGVASATLVANALLFSLSDQDSGIREPASHALSRFIGLITRSGDENLEDIGTNEPLRAPFSFVLISRLLRDRQQNFIASSSEVCARVAEVSA